VVGYFVFDTELAEPAIGKVDLNLGANPAKAEGVSFERPAVQQILKVTERYPYFLQQWA
jgi:hypothetical protein